MNLIGNLYIQIFIYDEYLAGDNVLGAADRHAEDDHSQDVEHQDRLYPLNALEQNLEIRCLHMIITIYVRFEK